MTDYVGRFLGTNADKDETTVQSSAASAHKSTSTRWSVLSERLQGLLTEAAAIGTGMEEYCLEMSDLEGPIMHALRTKMMSTNWKGEWEEQKTMFAYGEEMSTDPLEAQFIKALTTMKQPRRVLEVGMFTGYGAAAMLEGAPSTTVVSLEIDPYLKTWVSECVAQASEASTNPELKTAFERLEIITGPALDTMPNLPSDQPFDLVFVDANKSEYRRYIELLLEHKLLAPGAQIVVDNTLYCGIPYTEPTMDAQPARREFGNAIREFNLWVKEHPNLRQVILPMRDGVSIVVHDA
eukprot:CAMPEP_0194391822 /NCGR_PEP_ID=MMETSP0174-20130528/117962_1 /TAXON_ID=216777 /ORGANISM="Proboscia alata, Strain PI-D3" /LENGTH=293 /DNA_ID=CAMNT_0039186565 /DNA_START=133 /DNA_END=1014 /DNA_ORIENTATION=-